MLQTQITLKASCSILLDTSLSIVAKDFSTSDFNFFFSSKSLLAFPAIDNLKNGEFGGSKSKRSLLAKLLTPLAPTDWNGLYKSEKNVKPSGCIREGIVNSLHSSALSKNVLCLVLMFEYRSLAVFVVTLLSCIPLLSYI